MGVWLDQDIKQPCSFLAVRTGLYDGDLVIKRFVCSDVVESVICMCSDVSIRGGRDQGTLRMGS